MKTINPPAISSLDDDWATTPLETAFYLAMSSMFKGGESFFCRAVNSYRPDVHDMLDIMNEFTKQEISHSKLHQQMNSMTTLKTPAAIEAEMDWFLRKLDFLPRYVRLHITVILEHVTASLAYVLLTDKSVNERLIGDAKKVWLYHAQEEIEHRYVAVDVAIAGGCPDEIRVVLVPVVYAGLLLAMTKAFVRISLERKSLKGTLGTVKLIRKIIKGTNWLEPMHPYYYPV